MSWVNNEGEISFTKLLAEFKIPVVHYDIDSNCPSSCKETEDCSIIRGAHRIAHKIVDRIKSIDKIFVFLKKSARFPPIGTIIVITRCGNADRTPLCHNKISSYYNIVYSFANYTNKHSNNTIYANIYVVN